MLITKILIKKENTNCENINLTSIQRPNKTTVYLF